MRPVREAVYARRTTDWNLTPEKDERYVYDGWNVVEVLDGMEGNSIVKKYTWGLDLSGLAGNGVAPVFNRWDGVPGIHGAGGIGGLLVVQETATTGSPSYWFLCDANGNVGEAIKASDQSIAAHYECDPYGNAIVSTGTYAAANFFRFSTKWFDPEAGPANPPITGTFMTRDRFWPSSYPGEHGNNGFEPISGAEYRPRYDLAVWDTALEIGLFLDKYMPVSCCE